MRSFGFCAALALLLCVQVFAQTDAIVGKWTSPKTTKNDPEQCCVPDSITIIENGSRFKGTYDYSKWLNPSCVAMFLLSSERDVDIYKKYSSSSQYGIEVPMLDVLPWEGFQAKILANGNLQIYNTGNSTVAAASLCDFTMSPPGALSSIPIKYIIIAVVVLLLLICILCKCRQNKQVVLIQQEAGYVQPQYGNQVTHQQPQRYI